MSDQPPNYELLVETLSSSELISFVSDHPEVVNIKFWHGQSALHKVCLRTEVSVDALRSLVEAGADVNAANDFKETPLMFAAKRGSSSLCQYLLDNKADHTLCDKAGRSVIHHAVMGGSCYLVHYLRAMHDFQLEVEDNRKQTPLHVACSQGNVIMVSYLLRSLQCDCKKADMFGNTALHHAATYGHEQIVSALLSHAGLSVMDAVNQKGQTPMEVCVGKGSVHRVTNEVFLYALDQKKKGYNTLQPPNFLWFWYLLMPFTFFTIGGILAEIVQGFVGWYSGSLVSSASLLYILYLFQVHSHRIKHVIKLPNPMYAGAFGAGLIGTFAVWLFAVLPELQLWDNSVNILTCMLVILLIPPTYYLYWRLITSNPGYLPLPDKGMSVNTATKLAMRLDDSPTRFCAYCDTLSPALEVKHCKLCERCVIHMDHHCLFLLKCVAKTNHRLFTTFILITNIDVILFLISSWRCFYTLYGEPELAILLSHMATEHNFVFFVIILNSFSSIWGIVLLQWQLRFISEGRTFYESLQGERMSLNNSKPTLRMRCSNLVRFFCGNRNISNDSTFV